MIDLKIKDNILFASYEQGLNLDMEKARNMVEERLRLQGNKPYPLVISINGLRLNASKSVRMYMATEGIRDVLCGAFIVKNFYERSLLRFFLLVNSPKVPTRLFENEEEAVAWIRQEYLNK